MKHSKFIFIAVIASLFFFSCARKSGNWNVISPDSSLKITLLLDHSSLFYQAECISGGKWDTVIKRSPLGIERSDMDFTTGLAFTSISDVKTIDESYKMLIGKQLQCRNHANEITLTISNSKGSEMQVIARAYNDGVAFRYAFAEKSDTAVTIKNELSAFRIPTSGKAWMQPYDTLRHWSLGYEIPYEVAIPVGTKCPTPWGWCFPLLFELNNGTWIFISEADLNEQYCGMHIKSEAPEGQYSIDFPGAYEMYKAFSRYPSTTLPMQTPWRFILISKSIAGIVESNMVYNLSAPNAIGDTSWIKPGVASWSWWSDVLSSSDYKPLKDHVDLSHEMGWTYSLVDADWDIMINGNITQLADYAKTKNVGLALWYNSGGPNNHVQWRFVIYPDSLKALKTAGIPAEDLQLLKPVIGKEFFPEPEYLATLTELLGQDKFNTYKDRILKVSRFNNAGPRDRFYLPEAREKEFTYLNELGIAGIKVDFFMSDMQEVIKLYLGIFRDAAKHHIVVNSHGCTLPRGWSRTYPNLLSMEAVMGEEMYGGGDWPERALVQNTLYPFIRNVVGPMDYTPAGFSVKVKDHPHLTTYAHELALCVVYENGILHIAEGAAFLRKMPKPVLDFLKAVPTTWDSIHFIDGYPAKYTILQRAKNGTFYIAGINGEKTPRNVAIPLLSVPEGKYTLQLFADGASSKEFSISEKEVSASDTLKVGMRPAGGFIARLIKK